MLWEHQPALNSCRFFLDFRLASVFRVDFKFLTIHTRNHGSRVDIFDLHFV